MPFIAEKNMNVDQRPEFNIISLGADPIASTLACILQTFCKNNDSHENTLFILADSSEDNWNNRLELDDSNGQIKLRMKYGGRREFPLSTLCRLPRSILYFRLMPSAHHYIHPLAFLTKCPGVQSLIVEFPDDFDFKNDSGVIEIMKNWVAELRGGAG